jgi:maltose alpha-D-glucosyltransferase/alpha-amylase
MDQGRWYKNAVFYQIYLRAFKDANGDGVGDLRGLTQKLDYLADLGVDCIWLMPIFPSPQRDDGYDVSDFYGIADVYGTLEDFRVLLDTAHARGIRLILDLVMNHTSDQHPWFQSARRDRHSPFRDYYVWSDSDGLYKAARIIFLDVESSNWRWDDVAGQFYWHRFYSSQPDLNYDNPRVQEEMLNVARFWLALGVDGLRTDAVPYLFEREGTSCENLPETHAYLRKLRAAIDLEFPGRMLLCEANQTPEDVRPYFGEGDEFHMAFHFPVMPRIYMSIGKGNAKDLREILQRTPRIPDSCQWCTFLRNHDELTLEMVSDDERQWMWERYAPESRMRLNLGIRRRLAPLLDNDARKIKLLHSLLFTLPGSPIIYYGDEIGMGDNIWLPDRHGLRTPMQWNSERNAGFSGAPTELLYSRVIQSDDYGPGRVSVADERRNPDSIWSAIRHMLRTRKEYSVFGWGELSWLDVGNDRIAAYRRRHADQEILAIHNLSDSQEAVRVRSSGPLSDLLTARQFEPNEMARGIELTPYQYLWLTSDRGSGSSS